MTKMEDDPFLSTELIMQILGSKADVSNVALRQRKWNPTNPLGSTEIAKLTPC